MNTKLKKKDIESMVASAKAKKGFCRSYHKGLLTIYDPILATTIDVSGILNDKEIAALLS